MSKSKTTIGSGDISVFESAEFLIKRKNQKNDFVETKAKNEVKTVPEVSQPVAENIVISEAVPKTSVKETLEEVVKPEAMKIARANIEAKRMEAFEDWVYHNRKESSQSWKCTMTDWLRAHFEAYDDGDLYKQFTGLNSYEELVEMIKNR